MHIGLFGGSFDPVHNGHLSVVEACLSQAGLDEVWFVPTALQPHKPSGPLASDEHRIEMLRLASVGSTVSEHVSTSLIEIERGGVSYTVDSLRELKRAYPENSWWLLMGADTLHDLPNWREPAAILEMAAPLVVRRPGGPTPDFGVLAPLVDSERLQALATGLVEMPPVDISSSEFRRCVAAGESIEGQCPAAVAEYIAANGLYLG